jgi:hypothetical protein
MEPVQGAKSMEVEIYHGLDVLVVPFQTQLRNFV